MPPPRAMAQRDVAADENRSLSARPAGGDDRLSFDADRAALHERCVRSDDHVLHHEHVRRSGWVDGERAAVAGGVVVDPVVGQRQVAGAAEIDRTAVLIGAQRCAGQFEVPDRDVTVAFDSDKAVARCSGEMRRVRAVVENAAIRKTALDEDVVVGDLENLVGIREVLRDEDIVFAGIGFRGVDCFLNFGERAVGIAADFIDLTQTLVQRRT
jgi:hypothetical protein